MAKDGLCAIVTGSASGLGAATAEILARSGARLVINYSSSQKEAEATAEVCRKAGAAEDFQRLYGVNTIGPFQMVRAARSLLEAGAKASGRPSAVVNVSSVAGISGVGSSIAYAASKGALNTITYSLARALAPLIRVNTICPGYIDTPWFTKGRGADGAAKVRDSVIAKVPLKRASP